MYKSLISTLFFTLCLIGIVVVVILYNKYDFSKLPNDYAIVFDAGSSGSRMFIYEWKSGFSAARGDPLVITEKFSCKTDDHGIDKIRSKKELVDKLSNCVRKANEQIPESRKKRTYLFLAATAGMRMLEALNKTQSDEIFGYIRDYFKSLNFLFKNESQARILTGQEEGTDAWISANYFENNFGSSVLHPTPETKGILDLGGASTQIVFVPKNASNKYNEFFSEIRILGRTYRPYSHSFLCWGIKEMTQLYQTYLLAKNDYRDQPEASCFPREARMEISGKNIHGSPCSNGLFLSNNTYNFTADVSKLDKNGRYSFSGASNKKRCEAEIDLLLPKLKCTYDNDRCSFNNVYQPSLEEVKFMGFSTFFYGLNNSEKLLKRKFDLDLEGFENATDFICSRTYKELLDLNSTNNANIAEPFLKTMCFYNIYMIKLTSRYGMKDFKNFKIIEKINGYSLNWALGYLINELNRDDFLPYEEPPRYVKFPLFLGLTLALGIFGSCFLIYVLHKKVRFDYHKAPSSSSDDTNMSSGAKNVHIRPDKVEI